MRFFTILIMTLASTSYSCAADLSNCPMLTPENCAQFLQLLYGENEKPSEKYSLTITKGVDLPSKNGMIPTYFLRADGIPNGRKFKITHRNAVGRTIDVFEGAHLGDGKILRNGKGDAPIGTCEPLIIGGFERGEPSQFLFLDLKEETTNAAFYLPYPVEPAFMDEMKVTMHYVNPLGYLFDIENLMPGEKIYVKAKGELGEGDPGSMNRTFIASKSGKVSSLVLWKDSEIPNGNVSYKVRRGKDKLVIEFPWIRESDHLPAPLVIFTINHSPTVTETQLAKEVYFLTPVPDGQTAY